MKRTATAARPVSPAIGATALPEGKPTRVLIVDDHPIVISGCRALLASDPDIVITTAADAESGEASFVAEPPDICLIDINLPSVSGFELARRILRRDPSARIIMFSMNDDPVFAARAIEAGAKGYVSKSITCLLRMPRGGGSGISRTMLAGLADSKNKRSAS
jgi:PleD family two-component response regulator